MTERQRNKEALQFDMRYQAMLFVDNNARLLIKNGINDGFSLGDYMILEKYMVNNNKNAHTITLEEGIKVLKDYRS
jgi:hypothetical protein